MEATPPELEDNALAARLAASSVDTVAEALSFLQADMLKSISATAIIDSFKIFIFKGFMFEMFV
jgi:hypothetical protein